jgi:hypothetical protein
VFEHGDAQTREANRLPKRRGAGAASVWAGVQEEASNGGHALGASAVGGERGHRNRVVGRARWLARLGSMPTIYDTQTAPRAPHQPRPGLTMGAAGSALHGALRLLLSSDALGRPRGGCQERPSPGRPAGRPDCEFAQLAAVSENARRGGGQGCFAAAGATVAGAANNFQTERPRQAGLGGSKA